MLVLLRILMIKVSELSTLLAPLVIFMLKRLASRKCNALHLDPVYCCRKYKI